MTKRIDLLLEERPGLKKSEVMANSCPGDHGVGPNIGHDGCKRKTYIGPEYLACKECWYSEVPDNE